MSVAQRRGAPPPPSPSLNGSSLAANAGDTSGLGAAINLTDISKVYGRGPSAVLAVDRLTLSVRPGEFVCLIGASGCGKSTLLSMVAGLDSATSGAVDTGGKRVSIMFQEPALFPWLTARKNVELAMQARDVPKQQRRLRAL